MRPSNRGSRIIPALGAALVMSLGLLSACGPNAASPIAAPPRESGQSRLMDNTFAGKSRCNAKEHERPFVVEWDATDMSSFQARTSSDVVFVKYEGCSLTVIDSCSDDSVRGALGSYKPVDWTGGAVEKVDIGNAIDLYAKLPLGAALLGGRVEAGEKFHMEYFVSGTRSATRPAVYQADLARIAGCAGVTHFVYGINLGAYVLASSSGSKASAGGTVMGAGAGGSSSQSSAIEKKAGEIGSCRGESAKEVDSCKTPIRLTLREITPGENPDAQAARAPETPSALNLAGMLQARTDQEREAGEHMNAAQTKLGAGDGRGCLSELDAHDRLDPRPAGLSTSPKGSARLRALCLMSAGQCGAGKELARKSWEATSSQVKPEEIDRYIDSDVATRCRAGTMTDRDRLLSALYIMSARQERTTAADCTKAYQTALKLVDGIKPRDNYDAIYDAPYKIGVSGPACFARAGDCAAAWRAAKEGDEAYGKVRGYTSDARTKRSRMMSATEGTCVDKEQGSLSDVETVFRVIAELASARSSNPPSVAFCMSRVDRGIVALKRGLPADAAGELKLEAVHLADAAAECLSTANDCTSAWKRFAEVRRAFPAAKDDPSAELHIRANFVSKVPACTTKPQGTMTAREKVYWAASVIKDGARTRVDPKQCLAAYDAVKRGADEDHGEKKLHSEWNYGTRDIPRDVGRCLQKAGDCTAAWTSYKDAHARFADASARPTDPAKLRERFDGDVPECKGH